MNELQQLKNTPKAQKKTRLSHDLIKFVVYLFTRQTSAFITVFGRRETGKTSMALLLAEILHKHAGFKFIASNIEISNDQGIGITHINNLDDLKLWCKDNKGRKLFIFDEIGRTIKRRSPMASLNVKLIGELQILRKYKLSIIGCTIDPKYVDNNVLGDDILDGCFIKPWIYERPRDNQKVALYNDLLRKVSKRIDGLPATTIEFNTWGTALFTEHGPLKIPAFKKPDLTLLWKWANGETIKDLKLSRTQFHRISKKFIKEMLERQRTT